LLEHLVKIIGLLVGGVIWALANQAASFSGEDLFKATVAKVRAYHPKGTVTLGSAVLSGGERLVTNCHVIATAQSVQIVHNGRNWRAEVEAQDSNHDLCILRAAGVTGVAAVAATSLTVGQKVFAAGFPGGNQFAVTAGRIVALHDYDGAEVIQVSSPFDYGASGGGLFDEDGRLIGILTFKARAGGKFHFALPIAWAKNLDRQEPEQRSAEGTLAFWQQSYEKQPYFLRAASLEAGQKWGALAALGEQWIKDSPMNPTAWTAVGTAFRHLQRPDEALLAFGEAKLLLTHEPQRTRHARSLTYVSTKVTGIGHPVSVALPGFDPTGIDVLGQAKE
jgi:serine protease Do